MLVVLVVRLLLGLVLLLLLLLLMLMLLLQGRMGWKYRRVMFSLEVRMLGRQDGAVGRGVVQPHHVARALKLEHEVGAQKALRHFWAYVELSSQLDPILHFYYFLKQV